MKKIIIPVVIAAALCIGTFPAIAQTAKDLVGAWSFVTIDTTTADGTKGQPFGPTPQGYVIFSDNGRFVWLVTRPGRAKFVSGRRDQGTNEENKDTVQGSLGYAGTYKVADNNVIMKIEATTYPNDQGAEQKRMFTLTGDELKWMNPTTTTGASAVAVLKRVK
jgi:Lipocalin-like domain